MANQPGLHGEHRQVPARLGLQTECAPTHTVAYDLGKCSNLRWRDFPKKRKIFEDAKFPLQVQFQIAAFVFFSKFSAKKPKQNCQFYLAGLV